MIQDKMNPLHWNLELVGWFFDKNRVMLDLKNENDKQELLNKFTLAIGEDPYAFTRFMLWIANNRKKGYQEIIYNAMCHYLAIFWPHFLVINLHLIIQFGKKDDILYFLKVPQIQAKIYKWIKHHSESDPDYKQMLETGQVIGKCQKRVARYQPKNKDWATFLDKILDDPIFNGIQAGDLDINHESVITQGQVSETD